MLNFFTTCLRQKKGSVTQKIRLNSSNEEIRAGITKVDRFKANMPVYGSVNDPRMGSSDRNMRCKTCDCKSEGSGVCCYLPLSRWFFCIEAIDITAIMKQMQNGWELTITSGENTPNCTFLIRLRRHFECVKFKLGFEDITPQLHESRWDEWQIFPTSGARRVKSIWRDRDLQVMELFHTSNRETHWLMLLIL